MQKFLAFFTAERLSALLVYAVGGAVGAVAAERALTPMQWGGAALAVVAAIAVAVAVRTWPKTSSADAGQAS